MENIMWVGELLGLILKLFKLEMPVINVSFLTLFTYITIIVIISYALKKIFGNEG